MLLVIKGKVDDWRVHRNCAYLIYSAFVSMDQRTLITDAIPLMMDDEISAAQTAETDESLADWYKWASAQTAQTIWEKPKGDPPKI